MLGRVRAYLEEHDFSEGALGVGVILEGIEDLLQSHGFLRLLVHRLPYDAVRL